MRKVKSRTGNHSELDRALTEARAQLPTKAHTEALLREMKARLAVDALNANREGIRGAGADMAGGSALGAKGSAMIVGLAVLGATALWLTLGPGAGTSEVTEAGPATQTVMETEVEVETETVTEAQAVTATEVEAPTEAVTEPEARIEAGPASAPATAQPPEKRRIARRRPKAAAPAPAAATVDPHAEVTLIDRARKLLASDPRAALIPLREHAERFPRGLLEQERELMRIEALSATDQPRAAAERASAFLTRFSDSPHRRRIEALTKSGPAEHAPNGERLPPLGAP